jgi:cytochrome d ubiquinol oxidase subunit II
MIGGLILRGAAIEFRHVARRRRGWDRAFGVGSLTAALAQGWILGSIVTGLVLDVTSVVFAIAAAIGVVSGYVLLGSTYLLRKTSGGVALRARRYATIAVLA